MLPMDNELEDQQEAGDGLHALVSDNRALCCVLFLAVQFGLMALLCLRSL